MSHHLPPIDKATKRFRLWHKDNKHWVNLTGFACLLVILSALFYIKSEQEEAKAAMYSQHCK